jgi:hypothetical protein
VAPQSASFLVLQKQVFCTGEARGAWAVLSDQDRPTRGGDDEMLENLHRARQLGLKPRERLESGDLVRIRGPDARALAHQA